MKRLSQQLRQKFNSQKDEKKLQKKLGVVGCDHEKRRLYSLIILQDIATGYLLTAAGLYEKYVHEIQYGSKDKPNYNKLNLTDYVFIAPALSKLVNNLNIYDKRYEIEKSNKKEQEKYVGSKEAFEIGKSLYLEKGIPTTTSILNKIRSSGIKYTTTCPFDIKTHNEHHGTSKAPSSQQNNTQPSKETPKAPNKKPEPVKKEGSVFDKVKEAAGGIIGGAGEVIGDIWDNASETIGGVFDNGNGEKETPNQSSTKGSSPQSTSTNSTGESQCPLDGECVEVYVVFVIGHKPSEPGVTNSNITITNSTNLKDLYALDVNVKPEGSYSSWDYLVEFKFNNIFCQAYLLPRLNKIYEASNGKNVKIEGEMAPYRTGGPKQSAEATTSLINEIKKNSPKKHYLAIELHINGGSSTAKGPVVLYSNGNDGKIPQLLATKLLEEIEKNLGGADISNRDSTSKVVQTHPDKRGDSFLMNIKSGATSALTEPFFASSTTDVSNSLSKLNELADGFICGITEYVALMNDGFVYENSSNNSNKKSDIKKLQTSLSDNGFDTKGVDGYAGNNTKSAIQAYKNSGKSFKEIDELLTKLNF